VVTAAAARRRWAVRPTATVADDRAGESVGRRRDFPEPWSASSSTTIPFTGRLLFPAPVLGRLDLRLSASFGSVTIHIRD
jgi:hypothetical protein